MIVYIGIFYNTPAQTPKPCTLVAAKLAQHYPLKTLPHSKNLLRCIFEVLSTLFVIRKKTDLVIIDLYAYRWYYLAIISAYICTALKIPFAFFLHSHLLTEKLKHRNSALRNLLRKSRYNICPSNFFQHQLLQIGIESVVIPNPLQPEHYPCTRHKHPHTPHLLWVRNVHPKYDPEMAISVLDKLKKQYPDASLTLVGPFEPEYKNQLDAKIKIRGLEKQITFTGLLSNSKWVPLAATHNIFINTTTLDNAPVSVMEAAALGLPVVSTNVGGIPYLMEDEKEILLVKAGDAEAMKKQITRLMQSPDLYNNIATHARSRAEKNMWPQVHPLWDKLLAPIIKPISV